MDINWLWGLAAGALTTILGFLLAILWDISKEKRHTRNLDDSVMNVLSAGLNSVIEATRHNIEIVESNIKLLEERRINNSALRSLPLEYWLLVVAQPPKAIVAQGMLESLADSARRAHHINCAIDVRERFRSSSGGLSGYANHLSGMDSEILSLSKALLSQTEKLAAEINERKSC